MKNRSRIALLVVALFMLFTVNIAAYQSMSKIITVIDDKQVTHYETDAKTVQELLTQLKVEIGVKDEVSPTLDTKIENNMKITIDRWKPTVHLNVDGETTTKKTEALTVEEFLTSLGVTLDEGDVIEPSYKETIVDNMQITVKTREVKTEKEDRAVAYNTKVIETKELPYGEKKLSVQGKNGVKTVTIQKEYLGKELVNESVIDVVIKEQPTDEVILKGTYVKPVQHSVKDAFTGESYEYTKVYKMQATAYTSTDAGCNNVTASGLSTFVGMVAVDPSIIPLGTKIYVEGYGIGIAGDTGGAIKGNIVDLYFNSRSECFNFGRRHGVNIYILKDQSLNVRTERKSY